MKKRSASTGKKHKRMRVDWLPIAFIGLLLVAWHCIVVIRNVPEFILPSPVKVVEALFKEWKLLVSHMGVTLAEAFAGLGASIVLGSAFGLAMGYWNVLKRMLHPLFVITQTVPMYVLAPLFILWFGFGILPKIIVVFLVCFFPISISFAKGLENTDQGMEDLLRVMGASKWKLFRILRIPRALPQFFSGLKIASTYSIIGAVIAEWVGAQQGLGLFMTRAMKNFKTGAMFADVMLIVALSLLLYYLVDFIERRVTQHITNGGIS